MLGGHAGGGMLVGVELDEIYPKRLGQFCLGKPQCPPLAADSAGDVLVNRRQGRHRIGSL
jgi:hypothetical protein